MTDEPGSNESPIEAELRTQAQLHLLTIHHNRLEYLAITIHRATCPVLACTHTYAEVDPMDIQRAQYVLNEIDSA